MNNNYMVQLIVFMVFIPGCDIFHPSTQTPYKDNTPVSTSVIGETPTEGLYDIGDGGFLSSKPCAAPCFLGILPSETLFADVTTILAFQGYNVKCVAGPENTLECSSLKRGLSFTIGSNQSGKVSRVSFFPDAVIYLDDVIIKYGEPSQIVVGDGGFSEEVVTYARLFFDAIQAGVTLTELSEKKYNVLGSSEVESIDYLDALGYSRIKQIPHQPWKGYGEYNP
jgi:hypothetical protein